jgi:hypothetical protein
MKDIFDFKNEVSKSLKSKIISQFSNGRYSKGEVADFIKEILADFYKNEYQAGDKE